MDKAGFQVTRAIGFRAQHSHHGMLCEPSHFHDYVVEITMRGQANEEGFVCDFRAVKRIFNRVVGKRLHERNLDEIFEYPTAENVAVWVWERLIPFFPLYSITVREKAHSSATYFGP
jgi:6-pyruvoyltetrahydropterin/6-carboxytetrahydropterin synthase